MNHDQPNLRLAPLEGGVADVSAVHEVLMGAQDYSMAISGALPTIQDAQDVFTSIPPGVPRSKKHVLGIYLGAQLVGLADVIEGYPTKEQACIGLLLIAKRFRQQGIGARSIELIEQRAKTWRCDRLRLSVVETNRDAAGFWLRCGFVDTGRRVPYECGTVISQSMILEKTLPSTLDQTV